MDRQNKEGGKDKVDQTQSTDSLGIKKIGSRVFKKQSSSFKKKSFGSENSEIVNQNSFVNYIAFISILRKSLRFWKLMFFVVLLMLCVFLCLSRYSVDGKIDSNYNGSQFIAQFAIDGVIQTNDEIIKKIQNLEENKSVKAVIFKINSPGGTITGSEILYSAIKKLSSVKPTVAVVDDIGASGAYMASVATNYIVSRNSSMVGSIGVLMQYYDLTDVSSKIGIKQKTIKTSDFKGSPNAFEKSSPEVEKYMQDLLNDGYKYFVSIVVQNRPKLKKENIFEVTSGKVFTGSRALDLGLVDEIGDVKTALAFLSKNGIRDLEIKEISLDDKRPESFFERIFGKSNIGGSSKYSVMAIMD